jgi:hypothetical protein
MAWFPPLKIRGDRGVMKSEENNKVTPPAFAKATARQTQPPLIIRGGDRDSPYHKGGRMYPPLP